MQNDFCESFVAVFVTKRPTASLKILDNISSVINSTKNMIPIPLLVFRFVQAFGTAEDFVNLITK